MPIPVTALDRLMTPGYEPPDLGELIESLTSGEGDWSNAPEMEDPMRMDRGGGYGDALDVDDEGYVNGRAAEFATPRDLRNYAATGSLRTGDPGIGAWGDRTSGNTPFVAVPRDMLAKAYGSEDNARGRYVQVISPNGNSAVIAIGDKGPALRNRMNNAVIELNPAAKALLGTGDAAGYRYKLL